MKNFNQFRLLILKLFIKISKLMIKIIKIPLYKLIQININNNSKNNQFNILLNQVKNILKIN